MSLLFAAGSETAALTVEEMAAGVGAALAAYSGCRRVLAVPPDMTRLHSRAGLLTELCWQLLGDRLTDILPALGTHTAMSSQAIAQMFGRTLGSLFRVHRWREDVVTLGDVPSALMAAVSEGKLDYSWPAQVNRLLRDGGHDLILSLGQVVPHEVVGMANGSKNIFIGTGGAVGIDRSHFLGAVYGMERMMGRTDTPVRRVLNYASQHFGSRLPPILYLQTVIGRDDRGELVVRGLFIGEGNEPFERAAALSQRCNVSLLDREIRKAVVYLDPEEFHSTWLGNKSLYRTRMALADDGELIVLAPGVREFGEDARIDALIRRFGYRGTEATLQAVQRDAELAGNLSAAAHLIHGSSEDRFSVRYCPGGLTREQIEGVHYGFGDLPEYAARYDPATLQDGWNVVRGEEIFFIRNPGLGLWAFRDRFLESDS